MSDALTFEFQAGGRTFTCSVEEPRGSRTQAWWWFAVSDDACRYAPFPVAAGDTQETVAPRIAAYYDALLARRAMPAEPRHHWTRRSKEAAAEPATPAPQQPPTAQP